MKKFIAGCQFKIYLLLRNLISPRRYINKLISLQRPLILLRIRRNLFLRGISSSKISTINELCEQGVAIIQSTKLQEIAMYLEKKYIAELERQARQQPHDKHNPYLRVDLGRKILTSNIQYNKGIL